MKKAPLILLALLVLGTALFACTATTDTDEPESTAATTTTLPYEPDNTTTQPYESNTEAQPTETTAPGTETTGLLANPRHTWTQITIATSSWSAQQEELVWDELTLNREDAQRVHQLLSTMQTTAVPHPTHIESMQADTSHRIRIISGNETIETVYAIQGGTRFFRFLDTVGSSNDPGFVWGESDALRAILTA